MKVKEHGGKMKKNSVFLRSLKFDTLSLHFFCRTVFKISSKIRGIFELQLVRESPHLSMSYSGNGETFLERK